MRLLRNASLVIIAIILGLFLLTLVTSKGFAEIIDLVHKDTDEFHVGDNFSEPHLAQYQINGILFIPYTRQNPEQSYDQKFFTYSLRLASYKQKENIIDRVIINQVTIEAISDANFDKITKTLHKELEFSEEDNNENIRVSEVILITEINNYNMGLTDKSKIKVVLNVSVEDSGKIITRDLEYSFETRIRKYLVQPT